MRSVVLSVCALAILSACDLTPDTQAKLTFVNNTDTVMCYYPDAADPTGEDCGEVRERKETVWRPKCASGRRVDTAGTTVVLTVGRGGREIYNRTATCKLWNVSGGRIVIDQRNGEFIVTDALPSTTFAPTLSP